MTIPATTKLKETFERLEKNILRHTFVSKRYGKFHALIVVKVDDKKKRIFYVAFNREMF